MKKAKIMLTAITVLAVVGGALAFKAKKIDTIFCSTTTSDLAFCQRFDNATWTYQQGPISYCTTNGSECDVRGTIGNDF